MGENDGRGLEETVKADPGSEDKRAREVGRGWEDSRQAHKSARSRIEAPVCRKTMSSNLRAKRVRELSAYYCNQPVRLGRLGTIPTARFYAQRGDGKGEDVAILVGPLRFNHDTHVETFETCCIEQLEDVEFDFTKLFRAMYAIARPYKTRIQPDLTDTYGVAKVTVKKPVKGEMKGFGPAPAGLASVKLFQWSEDSSDWEKCGDVFSYYGLHFKTVEDFDRFYREWVDHCKRYGFNMETLSGALMGIRLPTTLGQDVLSLGAVRRRLDVSPPPVPRRDPVLAEPTNLSLNGQEDESQGDDKPGEEDTPSDADGPNAPVPSQTEGNVAEVSKKSWFGWLFS